MAGGPAVADDRAVHREPLWQAYFGTGIVSTSRESRHAGEAPSHPELLDWLAVEFMDRGWSLKTTAPADRDVGDLPAVVECDAGAAVAGSGQPAAGARAALPRGCRDRARHRAGGQRPAEREGRRPERVSAGAGVPVPAAGELWAEDLERGAGPDRYRRALYTFRFRSVPYPMLQTFDAPNGDISCVRRARSNTPLQALTTLNEPLFVESARALALRRLKEGGADRSRSGWPTRSACCLSRMPTADRSRTFC